MSLTLLGVGGGAGLVVTGPNDPNLGTLWLWLDVNDTSTLFQDSLGLTPVVANNDPVGLWKDKSGGGRDFGQGTAGNKPLYKTVQDGTPGVKFDEVDDWLQNVSTGFPSSYQFVIIAQATRTVFPGPANNTDPNMTSGVGGGTTIEASQYNAFVTQANDTCVMQQMTNRWVDGAPNPSFTVLTAGRTHHNSGVIGSPVSNIGMYMGKYSDNAHYTGDAIKAVYVYTAALTTAQLVALYNWDKLSGGHNTL